MATPSLNIMGLLSLPILHIEEKSQGWIAYRPLLSIILESQMLSSPVTRMSIPVTYSLKFWMGEIGISRSLSQDPGLVINELNKIDKGKKRIQIITNVVLSGGWGVAV